MYVCVCVGEYIYICLNYNIIVTKINEFYRTKSQLQVTITKIIEFLVYKKLPFISNEIHSECSDDLYVTMTLVSQSMSNNG